MVSKHLVVHRFAITEVGVLDNREIDGPITRPNRMFYEFTYHYRYPISDAIHLETPGYIEGDNAATTSGHIPARLFIRK